MFENLRKIYLHRSGRNRVGFFDWGDGIGERPLVESTLVLCDFLFWNKIKGRRDYK